MYYQKKKLKKLLHYTRKEKKNSETSNKIVQKALIKRENHEQTFRARASRLKAATNKKSPNFPRRLKQKRGRYLATASKSNSDARSRSF